MEGPEYPIVRVHLWLETREGMFLGLGRIQLLTRIDQLGSLKAAADSMGMSYRAAWGKIKQTERLLGRHVIEKKGGNKSGYRLTRFGVSLKEDFERWYADVEAMAVRRAREIFPYQPRSFDEAQAEADDGAASGKRTNATLRGDYPPRRACSI